MIASCHVQVSHLQITQTGQSIAGASCAQFTDVELTCRGLCGDASECARHYGVALKLGALPDRAAIGELLTPAAWMRE